jgi:hypothetical protein
MNWENQTERDKFLNAFLALAEMWDKECSETLIRMYFKSIEEHSIESVEAALGKALKTCRFFPKPVDINELCRGGNISDQAEVEWGKVIGAVEHVGPYKSVVFDDPTTMAVIETSGGWVRFCQDITFQNITFKRKDFVASWKAYKGGGIEQKGHLAGIIEQENGTLGYRDNIPEPVLISENGQKRITHTGEGELNGKD